MGKGGEGAIDLANKVVALCDQENNYAPLYDLDKTIEEKIETIAKKYMVQTVLILQKKHKHKLRSSMN